MTKKVGSKFWADSYIVLKSGEKVYLEENIYELERQMDSDSKKIRAEISGKDEEIVVKKKEILYYGEC